MTTALVTGANGFIGSNLSKVLCGRGWDVRGLVLKGTPEDFLEGTAVKIVYGDILRPDSLAEASRRVDVVFHLAALAADWGPAEKFFLLNARGTRNMLEASAAGGARRFVLMSSLAVHRYGGHSRSDENAPLDCPEDFPYGRSKIEAEEAVREFHDAGRIEGVIVRPGLFPFGPNDTTSFCRLARALERGLFAYVGGGRSRLTTAYVENLCAGVELAGREKNAAGQTYVIGDDEPVSWRRLIELFCRELGYRPAVPLEEAVRRTVAWYRTL
jgi:nucleoside-diphosphate-sugar epimerase